MKRVGIYATLSFAAAVALTGATAGQASAELRTDPVSPVGITVIFNSGYYGNIFNKGDGNSNNVQIGNGQGGTQGGTGNTQGGTGNTQAATQGGTGNTQGGTQGGTNNTETQGGTQGGTRNTETQGGAQSGTNNTQGATQSGTRNNQGGTQSGTNNTQGATTQTPEDATKGLTTSTLKLVTDLIG
ncbi:hypothetical protein ACIRU3_45345 [Streptomyces sp. NPDC101151]|uniref:hypothetical protein n=1 Tax=Streptomyces sp. NPDC101151 TaxID=3366115 RepID=UPI003818F636